VVENTASNSLKKRKATQRKPLNNKKAQLMLKQEDLRITSLGECRFPSPLEFDSPSHPGASHFLTDSDRIRLNVKFSDDDDVSDSISFEEAGPRKTIFFDPSVTTAAIVTCGGLSPGLNNVIRSVFYGLSETYGVRRVLGIRNGYLGLNPASGLEPVTLTKDFVEPIDKLVLQRN
jgi:6-phosphofructokinase 1